mmetsp:Transcript_10754/g.16575  ORF Transcript_10754/g.16575 Transcript_10754/m.16575 type:complete len:748 (+) Transcript_10754:117-2360(+)
MNSLLSLRLVTWFALGAIAVLPAVVHGQQPIQSQVTLSLNEFEVLFSSARLEDAERRVSDQHKRLEAEHKRKMQDLQNMQTTSNEDIRRKAREMFPDNFQVLQHRATGIYNASSPDSGIESDVASFDLDLTFRVMEGSSHQWTSVPLVNTSSTVAANWKVFVQNDTNKEYNLLDTVTNPSVLLLIRNEQQVLATNQSGLYKIQYQAFTRVAKTRNLHSMGLSSLLYPLSDFHFRLAKQNSNNTLRDFSVQPASSILQVQPFDDYADIKATLPLTADSIQLRWTSAFQTQLEMKESPESDHGTETKTTTISDDVSQVTATHESLYTIGEGIIRSVHNLEFESSSALSSLNSVKFRVVGENVRITSVVGHALQSWNIDQEEQDGMLICTSLKTSQITSKSIILQVHTEQEGRGDGLKDSSVELSRIVCPDVLRQTGYIAVIKDANVEVHEDTIRGLARCDVKDLSSKLRLNVDRPIVQSYKSLSPNYSIVLNILEHQAMETLEATIDRVHYKAVVTPTHIVHSMILLMQSTKLQYLEFSKLQPTASKFTVQVNSVSVKPVKGSKDSIMVPLLVGWNPETANEGATLHTSVELTYFSSHSEPLAQNGTLVMNPPQFDLPTSVYTAHLRLPKEYKYTFQGDFGSTPLKKLNFPIPQPLSYSTGKRVVREDYEFSMVDDAWPDYYEDGDENEQRAVKILTPNAGGSFFFQQLLVVDRGLKLHATYSEPIKEVVIEEDPWWKFWSHRRRRRRF